MRVLIAGAAGFIGSHLSEKFLNEGYTVIGVDDFSSGQEKHYDLLNDTYENFYPLRADVSEGYTPEFLELLKEEPLDGILHFASPASPPDYLARPFDTIAANVNGTSHLLGLALEMSEKSRCTFLYASTSEIYGDPHVHPQPETYWGNVNSIGPRSVYDEAKRMGETLTMAYRRSYGLDTRIIRIFNTYGPRMRKNDGRVVTNFINQCLENKPLTIYGDGSQTRSLCYVSDLVEGIFQTFLKGDDQPINLGNPVELTVQQIANSIQRLTNQEELGIDYLPLPQDDPKQRCPDIRRAQTVLGWNPQVSVDEGLLKTIRYFEAL